MRRLATLLAMVILTLLFTASSASAGGANGDTTVKYGPSDVDGVSQGRGIWDNPDYTRLLANPFGIASGKCITTWFDWRVSSGHYDARAVRSCKNKVYHQGINHYDDGIEMQKLAVCYAVNQETTPCKQAPNADMPIDSDNNGSFPNYCTRTWVLLANGSTQFGSGGSKTSCSS